MRAAAKNAWKNGAQKEPPPNMARRKREGKAFNSGGLPHF